MLKTRRNPPVPPRIESAMPAWATGRRQPLHYRRPGRSLLVILVLLAALMLFALLPEARFSLDAGPLVGTAERVADGDTLDIAGQRIRLTGIDAPEWDQTCTTADGSTWACGQAATDRLRQLVRGTQITCEPQGHDRYGRLLARCRVGTTDLAETIVRDGLAIATDRYKPAENEARSARRGLWQGPFATPAEWREETGRTAAADAGNPSRFDRFLAWVVGLFAR